MSMDDLDARIDAAVEQAVIDIRAGKGVNRVAHTPTEILLPRMGRRAIEQFIKGGGLNGGLTAEAIHACADTLDDTAGLTSLGAFEVGIIDDEDPSGVDRQFTSMKMNEVTGGS